MPTSQAQAQGFSLTAVLAWMVGETLTPPILLESVLLTLTVPSLLHAGIVSMRGFSHSSAGSLPVGAGSFLGATEPVDTLSTFLFGDCACVSVCVLLSFAVLLPSFGKPMMTSIFF